MPHKRAKSKLPGFASNMPHSISSRGTFFAPDADGLMRNEMPFDENESPFPEKPRRTISLYMIFAGYTLAEVSVLVFGLMFIALVYPRLQSPQQAAPYLVIDLVWVLTYALLARDDGKSMNLSRDYINVSNRIRHWFFGSVCALATAFLLKISDQFSRVWFICSFLAGMTLIGILGIVVNRRLEDMEKKRLIGSRIVLYGVSQRTARLLEILSGDSARGVNIEGVFDARTTRLPKSVPVVPVDSGIENLVSYIQKEKIDAVVMDLPWTALDRINFIVRRLESVNVDIFLAPVEIQMINAEYSLGHLGKIPTISLFERPMRGVRGSVKMILDYAGAAIGVLLIWPLLAVIAIAIKLDSPGPVFFRQPRSGMNNQDFMMYKFRTMRQEMSDINASQLTQRSDPRITRIGGFLRRTSMDELPQLLNVLRGEMSLVGPRPHAAGARAGQRLYPEVVERYAARHRVLPGITGLAQIRGFRGTTETENEIISRVDSDLEYIRTWSLTLDAKIIVLTALTFLWHKRAY